eukprot:10016099-Alexandrium_andersonii.AAC.1
MVGTAARYVLVLPAVDSAPVSLGDARPARGATTGGGTGRSVLAHAFAMECMPACEVAPTGLLLFPEAKGADGSVRPRVWRGRRGARGGNPSGRLVCRTGAGGHQVDAAVPEQLQSTNRHTDQPRPRPPP